MNFLSACNEMADLVQENIKPFVGSPAGGEIIRMGADHTPTEKIDQIAEECVINYIREHEAMLQSFLARKPASCR